MAIKRALYLCRMHLRNFGLTPVIYVYICLLYIFFHQINKQTLFLQQETGIRINVWGYTAGFFSTSVSTVIFGFGIVLFFSNLPLLYENALFESTRCSRNVWISGRVLYVMVICFFYTLMMFVLCMVTSHGMYNETHNWGKILNTLANGYSIGSFSIPIDISISITGRYTPIQSFMISFGTSFLSSFCIGLMMLFLSLVLGRMAALTGGCIISVFDFLIYLKLPYLLYHFSPLSLMRLSIICNPEMPYYPTMIEAVSTLLITNMVLIIFSFIASHNNTHFMRSVLHEQY